MSGSAKLWDGATVGCFMLPSRNSLRGTEENTRNLDQDIQSQTKWLIYVSISPNMALVLIYETGTISTSFIMWHWLFILLCIRSMQLQLTYCFVRI
jgi:hypothetical protein